MAERLYFVSTPHSDIIFKEVLCEFTYYNGFAISQKQKSIGSLHENIKKIDDKLNILEVSTKSTEPLGVQLSAFNLKFFDKVKSKEYPLENIFQSSKVFEHGGPYRDLLSLHPKDAKRDDRLTTSGNLIYFNFNDIIWELNPKTMFYDWIYIKALSRNKQLSYDILKYDAFTDIEFNHKKSVNCQARAAAIFVSLSKLGIVEEFLNDKNKFKSIYEANKKENIQTSIFD